MKIKIYIGILTALFFNYYSYSQTIQRGNTLEYNGKSEKTTLGGVQIIAGGATSVSDINTGSFTLSFNLLKNGDKLMVSRIAKSGYILFNRDEVESWIVDSSHPFEIVLCKAERFNELVSKYYNVSFSSYKSQYESECRKVQQLLKDNESTKAEYISRLSELESKYNEAIEKLEERAEMMARIDINKLTETERNALAKAQDGEIEEAILLLEGLNLVDEIDRNIKKKNEALNLKEKGEEIKSKAENDLSKLIEQVDLQINIYLLAGGEENLKKIELLYEKLVRFVPNDFDILFSFAEYLLEQNDYSRAEDLFLKAKALAKTDIDSISVLTDLGNLYFYLKNYKMAAVNYMDAVKISKKITNAQPDIFCLEYATALSNLSSLYSKINEFDSAIIVSKECLDYRQAFLYKDSSLAIMPGIAHTRFVLGNIYYRAADFKKAEEYLESAYSAYKSLMELSPYLLDETLKSLANLGSLHNETRQYQKAVSELVEVCNQYEKLLTNNPSRYIPSYALAMGNLGNLYVDLQMYDNADSCFRKAIEYQEQLYKETPYIYSFDYAMSLQNYALCLERQQKLWQAESYYKEASDIFKNLYVANPDIYISEYSLIISNLGVLHEKMSKYEFAESEFREALRLRLAACEKYPESYKIHVADSWYNLGHLHDVMYDLKSAENEYQKAINLYKEINNEYPLPYITSRLGSTLNNIALIYYKDLQLEKAFSTAEECLSFRKKLCEKDSISIYLTEYIQSLNTIGLFYQGVNDYTNAEKYYAESYENSILLLKEDSINIVHVLRALNNLADAYVGLSKIDDAEEKYLKATHYIDVFSKKSFTDEMKKEFAKTFSNAGIFHSAIGKNEIAEYELNKSAELYKDLNITFPNMYNEDIVFTLQNLGLAAFQLNKYDKASNAFAEAIDYCEHAPVIDKKKLLKTQATLYNFSGICYARSNQFSQANYCYEKSLENLDLIAKNDLKNYLADYAFIFGNQATLFSNQQRYKEAETKFKEALKCYMKAPADIQKSSMPSIASTTYLLAWNYVDMQQPTKSKKFFKKALLMYDKLDKTNSSYYSSFIDEITEILKQL